MPYAWTKAPTVETGDAITSAQRNLCSRAFNDRLRSGLGDPAWRVAYALYGFLRNIVHNDPPSEGNAGGNMTPDQFVQERVHNIEPDSPADLWPGVPPGENGGISQVQSLGHYTFGDNAVENAILPEYERTAEIIVTPILDDAGAWQNASLQRGWVSTADTSDLRNAKVIAEGQVWNTIGGTLVNDFSYGAWQRFAGLAPKLQKRYNRWRDLMRHLYAREYRGSNAQREEDGYFLQNSFNMSRFLATQFQLAPARRDPGDTSDRYPTWETSANIPAGGGLTPVAPAFNGYSWHPEFVCCKFIVRAESLLAATRLRITHSGGSRDVQVDIGDSLTLYDFNATRLQGVTVSAVEDVSLDAGGYLAVQFTEILAYKPTVADLATVLRLAGSRDSVNWDGRGTQCDTSDIAWDEYANRGVIANVQNNTGGLPDISPEINASGYYESIRHFTSRHLAMPHRSTLMSLALEGGVQKLWFRRFDTLYPQQDNWQSVYPIVHSAEAQGETNEWVMEVDLAPYDDSALFWTPDVYADQFGFFNRSLFAADELSGSVVGYGHLQDHINFVRTSAQNKRYEAPSLFNYAPLREDAHPVGGTINSCGWAGPGANPDCEEVRERFYASCRIYEPPVEIETVEDIPPLAMQIVDDAGNVVVNETAIDAVADPNEHTVRVELTDRLHHSAAAPAGYSADYWNWDPATLADEVQTTHRSNENGLRQYLLKWYWDLNPQWAIGDQGLNGRAWGQNATVTQLDATIFPHIRFVHLLPECYIDANETPDANDTKFLHDWYTQAEFYLRAMCEGYLDSTFGVRETEQCDRYMREWRYDDLIWYLSGGAYDTVPPMPIYATTGIPAGETRADAPDGFGPLPTVMAAAEHWNLLANGVNSLQAVRIPWQVGVEQRFEQFTGIGPASGVKEPSGAQCPAPVIYNNASGGPADNLTYTDPWTDGYGMNAVFSWSVSNQCNGSNYLIDAQRATYEFRIKPDDEQAFSAAMPPIVAELVANQDIAVPCEYAEYLTVVEKTEAVPPDTGDCGLGYAFTQKRICIDPAGADDVCVPGYTACRWLTRERWDPAPPPGGQYPITNCAEGSGRELSRTIENTIYPEVGIALQVPLKEVSET